MQIWFFSPFRNISYRVPSSPSTYELICGNDDGKMCIYIIIFLSPFKMNKMNAFTSLTWVVSAWCCWQLRSEVILVFGIKRVCQGWGFKHVILPIGISEIPSFSWLYVLWYYGTWCNCIQNEVQVNQWKKELCLIISKNAYCRDMQRVLYQV